MSKIKNEEQKTEMLREVGNIGAGNASKALSEISQQKINVEFPSVKSIRLEEIPGKLGKRQEIYTDVSVNVDIQEEQKEVSAGHLLLLMSYEDARNLAEVLEEKIGEEPADKMELGELEREALKETGNILTGASVSAITEYVDLKLVEGLPKIHTDMLGAILDKYLLEIAEKDDEALIFETEFKFEDAEIDANFMILFEPQGRQLVLNKMMV